MRGTLLFIHGTGVRKAGYDASLAILRDEFGSRKANIDVRGFLWGDPLGVKISDELVDLVLPLAETRGIGKDLEPSDTDLWQVLLNDPLAELRILSVGARAKPVTASAPLPGIETPAERLTRTLGGIGTVSLASNPDIPPGVLTEAARLVTRSSEFRDAVSAAGDPNDLDLALAIARAVSAETLARLRGELGTGPDALYDLEKRNAMVAELANQLAPSTKSIGSWIFGKVKGIAAAWATSYGTKRRDNLMVEAGPGLGDILYYQRRGEAILDGIEKAILDIPRENGPIVVLGHSLGGIMLVDLLSRPGKAEALSVAKLVTVGSQAPALYMCDALETVRLNGPPLKGKPFVPWQNFFDRNDLLSFCATRCFASSPTGIEDVEIKSGVSFPESHGAYLRQSKFYEEMLRGWP